MNCPVCQVPLTMSERQGIEIDYCPQCRGVWLDRGELDKIIERAGSQAAPPQAAQAGPVYGTVPAGRPGGLRGRFDDEDDDDHYRRRRRKSWLEEIFD